ncbi:MAG: uroporphyrinogen decarboxylase family protein, partial [Planctomycetota bacterium]|nr:uroporphyrinogen decarboxylase family protein [Planctomycetota bacterium]
PPDAGQLAEGIRRIGLLAEAGDGLVAVSLLDMAGGLNVAADLLGGDDLYLAMYQQPQALECLLEKIQQLFLATIASQIESAGGQEHITTTDFPDYWFPEGCKGHVSDDISANISPAMYDRFSRPFHNMIFEKYGGGGLHNCGPNPCLAGYLSHQPAIRSVDLNYEYSKNDLPAIKEAFRKKALIYMGGLPPELEEAIETFRQIMELMAPDVIVVPHVILPVDNNPGEVYRRMHAIAEEYAKRMDWGWEDEK